MPCFLPADLSLTWSLFVRMWVLSLIYSTHCLLTSLALCLCSPDCECYLSFILFCLLISHTLSLLARLWVLLFIYLIHCLLTSLSLHLCSQGCGCCPLFILFAACWSSLSLSLLARMWVLPLICLIHCLLISITLSLLPECEYCPLFITFIICWSLSCFIFQLVSATLLYPVCYLLTSLLLCLCPPGRECHPSFVLFADCWPLTHSVSAY